MRTHRSKSAAGCEVANSISKCKLQQIKNSINIELLTAMMYKKVWLDRRTWRRYCVHSRKSDIQCSECCECNFCIEFGTPGGFKSRDFAPKVGMLTHTSSHTLFCGMICDSIRFFTTKHVNHSVIFYLIQKNYSEP